MQRYLSIDVLRGLAIILMVQVHFVHNLSPSDSGPGWLYSGSLVLGSFPAPFFTFVSGLSYALWVRRLEAQRRRDEETARMTVRRGLFLFGAGLAFNVFIWLPDETFNWDILTLIGTSLLFLAFARYLPSPVLALACAMVLLLSPLLRFAFHFDRYWTLGYYETDLSLTDVVTGFVSNGYFPVFPWIVFPVMGYVSADLVFSRRTPLGKFRWSAAALGVGLLALSLLDVAFGARLPRAVARRYATGFTEFPASTEFVLAMLGLCILSLAVLHRWLDREKNGAEEGLATRVIRRYSAYSLTVYVLHHMVMLWPLWLYAVWQGEDHPTEYWQAAMSSPLALGLAGVFLVACYFLLVLLDRHRKFSLESVMRWVCD